MVSALLITKIICLGMVPLFCVVMLTLTFRLQLVAQSRQRAIKFISDQSTKRIQTHDYRIDDDFDGAILWKMWDKYDSFDTMLYRRWTRWSYEALFGELEKQVMLLNLTT